MGQSAPQRLPASQFCTKVYSLSDIRSISIVVTLDSTVDMAIPVRRSLPGDRPLRVSARR